MITEPPVELFTLSPEATTSTYTADGDGVAATTFRRQYTTHTILKSFAAHTRPAALPSMWSFLAPTQAVRELPGDIEPVTAALRANFSEAELLDSKLFMSYVDGLNLEPKLQSCDPFEFAHDERGRIANVRTDDGGLTGDESCSCTLALQQIHSCPRATRLYLASARDLHVLRYFGMQGTVASGLEQIPGPQLRRLLVDREQANPAICRLTLVAWDVAHLRNEMPPQIARVLTRLYDAAKVYEWDDSQIPIDVWAPAPEDFERICAAVTFADARQARLLLRRSIGRYPQPALRTAQELRDQPPLDLEVAVAKLQDEVILARASSSGPDLLEAVKNLRDVNDKLTTQRYYVAAQSAKSPEKSQLWMLLAENSRKLQRTSEPLTRAEEIYRNQPPIIEEVFGTAPSETHEELTRGFMQLLAALRKC